MIDQLSSGGAQRQLATLAVALRRREHEVEVFVYHRENFQAARLRAEGIAIHEHPKASRYSLRPVLELRRRMERGGYDGVLSFLTSPNLYGLLARATLRGGPPLVVSERSSPLADSYGARQRFAERAYRLAAHVTVNSHHLREYYVAKHPGLAERVTTIWNGVDLERFHPGDPPPRSETPSLLAMGALAPTKNGLSLIEALARLRDRDGVRARVDWLVRRSGRLLPSEAAYRGRMERALDSLGLVSQWCWLPEQDDVVSLLHAHDALVHPSSVEGLPNAVCESLACGRPALVSDTLDHPRLVRHGERGFLFDVGDPESLADALLAFHRAPDQERVRMGLAARRFAQTQLSAERLAEDYEGLFRSLMA